MTNYERIMSEMTPEKLADGIANACCMCAYREETRCGFRCTEGIEKWLNQEAEDHEELREDYE